MQVPRMPSDMFERMHAGARDRGRRRVDVRETVFIRERVFPVFEQPSPHRRRRRLDDCDLSSFQ